MGCGGGLFTGATVVYNLQKRNATRIAGSGVWLLVDDEFRNMRSDANNGAAYH